MSTVAVRGSLTALELAVRLAVDDDERVSGWAADTLHRVEKRELNFDRAYSRLLRPFVDAGLVALSDDGSFYATTDGVSVVLVATRRRRAEAA